MAEFIKLFNKNPDPRLVSKVVDCLQTGGVIIYPTDTVYGIGCDIYNRKAIEKVAQIKGLKIEKANFSFICYDLSHISDYTKQLDKTTYKLLRRALPGPFTFILKASSKVPKIFESQKKTVGIRIPDNNIILTIVKELGNPILTSSIHDEDSIIEYSTDPELIYEKYQDLVDIVIDGGCGGSIASTVVDCSTDAGPMLIRQGKGNLDEIL
ncbi:MAG: threonylcarbamoyl-AMP synthase [Candidatus Margulisiibacteriota bacterium]|nr:MAG: threonylcarbamoyl-AMP synthase [Candidatus Margulisiibacteriota bacterium]HCY36618.1 threonylcarbamoyl-AMP synthase [Candidatus Margulisiibacteriota bacterium]